MRYKWVGYARVTRNWTSYTRVTRTLRTVVNVDILKGCFLPWVGHLFHANEIFFIWGLTAVIICS